MDLATLILSYNHPFSNPVQGSVIHPITERDAADIAPIIEDAAHRVNLPVAYLAACICRESNFDPLCIDQNLTVSDRTPSFERTDWGIAQFSGRYLPGYPGMKDLTNDQMVAKAMDIEWAINTMADAMDEKVGWALRQAIPNYDPFFVATLAYNAGEKGAMDDIAANDIRKHPYAVMMFYHEFVKALGPTPKPTPTPPTKLWLLRPSGYVPQHWTQTLDNVPENWSDDPHNKAFGFVVRADTEHDARLMVTNLEPEGPGKEQGEWIDQIPAWSDSDLSTCIELTDDGEPGLIIRDYYK